MSELEKHIIAYPGFAEEKHARGLYRVVEQNYGTEYGGLYTFHNLPFYSQQANGDRIVHSLYRHADILQDYMDDLEGEITILAKCGGTRVVAAMDDEYIARAKTIAMLNAPEGIMTEESLQERIVSQWKGGALPDGSWFIPRGGGMNYVAEPGYMKTVGLIDMLKRAREIASLTKLFFVRGMRDEVVRPICVEKISGAMSIDIESGDHHFMKLSRQELIGALALHGVLHDLRSNENADTL